MPLMVNDAALRDFREQLARGVKRPRLHEGAFDEMTPQLKRRLAMDRDRDDEGNGVLPGGVKKALDAMSRSTRDSLRKYLARDADPDDVSPEMGGEDQEPALPATLSQGTGMPAPGSSDEGEEDGKLDRLCSILEEIGLPDDKVRQVR
jgi:hypothetical protein